MNLVDLKCVVCMIIMRSIWKATCLGSLILLKIRKTFLGVKFKKQEINFEAEQIQEDVVFL